MKLRDKSGKIWFHFNLHTPSPTENDGDSNTAAKECPALVISEIQKIAGNNPVTISGDFNLIMTHDYILPYYGTYKNSRLESPASDNMLTYNAVGKTAAREMRQLDHILYKGAVKPLSYRTVEGSKHLSGVSVISGQGPATYISDHYPIVFTFEL